jgi:hypothetical protein
VSDPSAIIAAALGYLPGEAGPPLSWDAQRATRAVLAALEAEGYTIARLEYMGPVHDILHDHDIPVYRILPEEDR